jgi:putative transcriptional regulator
MENRMREFREQMDMTQEQLAEKSGVSRVTISGLESGRMQVAKTTTLVRLADALGKPVTTVFFTQDCSTCKT